MSKSPPETSDQRVVFTESQSCDEVNLGMPSFDLGPKPISFFEFWPTWFFYVPIVAYWLVLGCRYRNFALPMLVNPSIPLGGMVGESKSAILNDAGPYAKSYILPYIVREYPMPNALEHCDDLLRSHVDTAFELAAEQGINCPFVVKPELGCRGTGVSVVDSREKLCDYLKSFPQGRKYIIQKMAPYAAEVGVFYERDPCADRGAVTSITLKYRPYVVGDGRSTLKTLILQDKRASILRDLYFKKNRDRLYMVPKVGEAVALAFAGSHCRGSIFRNGNRFITEKLSDQIDKIMQDFPEFHYGRLDIKFEDIAQLQRGERFVIIEVNGASSEKTHIWDSRTRLCEAFATLFEQYTTLFNMGRKMRDRGYKSPSARQLIVTWLRELKQSKRYPDLF